jgi:hypothetical protein
MVLYNRTNLLVNTILVQVQMYFYYLVILQNARNFFKTLLVTLNQSKRTMSCLSTWIYKIIYIDSDGLIYNVVVFLIQHEYNHYDHNYIQTITPKRQCIPFLFYITTCTWYILII